MNPDKPLGMLRATSETAKARREYRGSLGQLSWRYPQIGKVALNPN
jgi:hypothetical protein